MDFSLAQSINILERTPYVLKKLLENLSDEWIYRNEGTNTWSPFDILGHLIHGEITDWIPRVEILIDQDPDKRFKPFDRFAHFEESRGKTANDLLEEFKVLREKNLEKLDSYKITPSMLNKEGIHPEFGTVTLLQLISTWVVHDLEHIAQICRVMAKQYKAEVGPWTSYLPILGS